ncbi:MarR family transcriptional regulator [Pseudonocardia acidicola]
MTGVHDTAPDTAATRVWQRMRALVLDQHDRRREVSETLGMSFIRAKALRQVVAEPMTMRELADRLNTDPPYVTVVVDDLERRGLVRRMAHPGDRRCKVVTATSAGADAAAVAERILGRPPQALRSLCAADLAELDRILAGLASG